jgi:hypothetical protein
MFQIQLEHFSKAFPNSPKLIYLSPLHTLIAFVHFSIILGSPFSFSITCLNKNPLLYNSVVPKI